MNRNFTASRPDALWVCRLHLLLDVVGHRLRRLRHRRVLPAPGRMEGGPVDDDDLSSSTRSTWRRGRAGTPPSTVCCATRTPGVKQYTSISYTERLDDVGAAPSIGTIGDCFDNAMAESVMGLFKTELHRNPGRPGRQRRTLEGPRRPRDRHLCLGVVVQRGAAALRARRPDASRVRGRLRSQVSARRGMRKPNQRAFVKPRPIQIFLSTNDSTTRELDHQRISPMTEEAGV